MTVTTNRFYKKKKPHCNNGRMYVYNHVIIHLYHCKRTDWLPTLERWYRRRK